MKSRSLVAAVAITLGLAVPLTSTVTASAAPNEVLGVQGNHLVSHGHVVRLLGVQPQGLESQCATPGYGYFDGPHNQAAVDAMKGWGSNAVRISLNSNCWLGRHVEHAGKPYRKAVINWIKLFRANDVFVVIDNHTASDSKIAGENLPMADDSAIKFWKSMATAFKSTGGVLFDVYNEPHEISWKCWRDGCTIPAGTFPVKHGAYHSPGMQALVNAVRSTGASQPIMLGGLDWSNDVSKWAAYLPHDPRHQLVVSQHTYGPSADGQYGAPCDGGCRADLARLAKTYPVVVGELGEFDCAHGYIDAAMQWLDAHGIGYIGGAWNAIAPGSYQCGSPALLKDYDFPNPTPSAYGIGLRDHLRELAGL